MARKAKAATKTDDDQGKRRRRGGRKPGTWKLLTPDKLREFRDTNKISRARLAQMLGVSSTSVQNWETGTVASMKIQQRLAELMAAGPAALLPPRKAPSLWDASAAAAGNPSITATGTIVSGYVQTHKDLSTEDLVGLIRSVRQALS